jgi:DNA-binding Xre family transcriptional regulator
VAQKYAVVNALKRALRNNGFRYADVARHLGLSESSVKRLFADANFSLERLDLLCQMMNMEMSDLILGLRDENRIKSLAIEQEKELVADVPLLLIANSVLNKWSFDEILEHYDFKSTELIQYLARLDRLKLIELLPGNRIKVLVDRDFHWLKDGPINAFFETCVRQEFFNSRFNEPGEQRQFMIGMLSRTSNAILQRKLDKLKDEFHALHYEDEALPRSQKFGTTVVIGMRLWEPEAFEALRKKKDDRTF